MTDHDLDTAEARARDFLTRTEAIVGTRQTPERLTLFHAARVICDDMIRAVDMVRAERSARRSVQAQRDTALARILARDTAT